MTLNRLASLIDKRDIQARIGDIRECLRIIVELHADAMESGDTAANWFGSPGEAICTATDKLIEKRAKHKKGGRR